MPVHDLLARVDDIVERVAVRIGYPKNEENDPSDRRTNEYLLCRVDTCC